MDELTLCSTGMTPAPLAKGLVDATPNQRDLWDKLVASVSLSRSGTAFAEIASRSFGAPEARSHRDKTFRSSPQIPRNAVVARMILGLRQIAYALIETG
jgi:hypothetical protein